MELNDASPLDALAGSRSSLTSLSSRESFILDAFPLELGDTPSENGRRRVSSGSSVDTLKPSNGSEFTVSPDRDSNFQRPVSPDGSPNGWGYPDPPIHDQTPRQLGNGSEVELRVQHRNRSPVRKDRYSSPQRLVQTSSKPAVGLGKKHRNPPVDGLSPLPARRPQAGLEASPELYTRDQLPLMNESPDDSFDWGVQERVQASRATHTRLISRLHQADLPQLGPSRSPQRNGPVRVNAGARGNINTPPGHLQGGFHPQVSPPQRRSLHSASQSWDAATFVPPQSQQDPASTGIPLTPTRQQFWGVHTRGQTGSTAAFEFDTHDWGPEQHIRAGEAALITSNNAWAAMRHWTAVHTPVAQLLAEVAVYERWVPTWCNAGTTSWAYQVGAADLRELVPQLCPKIADSLFSMGLTKLHGRGDEAFALRVYELAGALGSRDGMFSAASMYMRGGRQIRRDVARARHLFRQAGMD